MPVPSADLPAPAALPLAGPTVVVTRPQPQADEWVLRLRGLGQAAVALPLMGIEPQPADAPALRQTWARLLGQVQTQALPQPQAYALLMFVSPNAVLQFFAAAPAGFVWPALTRAAATGPGTQAALRQAGVPADLIDVPRADSARFDAEALWSQVLQDRDWAGRQVLIVRGEDGRDWLAGTLRQAGAQVDLLAAYRRVPPDWNAAQTALLDDILTPSSSPVPRVAWLFSSSQCVDHLMAQLQQLGAPQRVRALALPALATHPRIAQTALDAGFSKVLSVVPDAECIVAALAG